MNSQILDGSRVVVIGNQKPEIHFYLSTTSMSAVVNCGHFIFSSLAFGKWTVAAVG